MSTNQQERVGLLLALGNRKTHKKLDVKAFESHLLATHYEASLVMVPHHLKFPQNLGTHPQKWEKK